MYSCPHTAGQGFHARIFPSRTRRTAPELSCYADLLVYSTVVVVVRVVSLEDKKGSMVDTQNAPKPFVVLDNTPVLMY